MNFSPSESPISQLGLQLPGRSALPHGESPAAQRRPVPGQGGVRSSPPAPTLTFPLRSPRPCTPSNPVSPAPGPAKPRLPMERGRREARGKESKSEPAGAVPPSPAARAQGARDSAADARCRCGGSCCSCGCGWASGSGRAALGAGRRGAAAPATRSHSPQAAAAARVSHQYSRAAPGSRAKARKKAGLTGGSRGARLGSGARQLCSNLALPGAPGSAAGTAHELPT